MQPRTELELEQLYELGEEIGNGQSAVVRRAVERATSRSYAAKLVRRRRGAAAQAEARREASVLAALRHPNLVALHETFETSLHTVFVLELVSGGELEAVLEAKGGRLGEVEAADVVRQILLGLEHMHERGIAHLDLKPENVMVSTLSPPWQVKLIDFGLSREVAGGDERALQGTPEFLAPEAVNFEPLSLATDIWAVGVITYLLLTGASPFLGEDKQATFCNIVAGEYDTERLVKASSRAPALISRILVHSPRKRPSAGECLADAWLLQINSKVTEVKRGHTARRRWRTWVQVISVARHLSLQRNSETSSDHSSTSSSSMAPSTSSEPRHSPELISLTSSINENSAHDIYLHELRNNVDELNNRLLDAQTEETELGANKSSTSSSDEEENRLPSFISSLVSSDDSATSPNDEDLLWNHHVSLEHIIQAVERLPNNDLTTPGCLLDIG
ncbi:hypothetical protein B566_EDAN001960 [Ephemera danica]|nr:hypothetical protein B566_EDAN001960 [Ephemera danica]